MNKNWWEFSQFIATARYFQYLLESNFLRNEVSLTERGSIYAEAKMLFMKTSGWCIAGPVTKAVPAEDAASGEARNENHVVEVEQNKPVDILIYEIWFLPV